MKTSSKMLFMSMLITSTTLVMSSSSLMNMWIGLEINLMAFIPLISSPKNMFMSQSTMMYFLIQSMASMMFIMFILMNKYIFSFMTNDLIKTMITLTMMMKMGMPPFHMWFPEIMNKISWPMCLVLMTWQKLAPMYIISMTISMNKLTVTIICASAIMGAIGGVNQTSTRKIMAYSSMNHMSWMISCAAMFKKSWIMYMMLYSMLMMIICMMMYNYNIMFINQMNILCNKNMEKMIILSLMLSLGGLPPFLGFLPKWITIQYMISSKEILMMIIMMMAALITLMYYLRMSTTMNLLMSHSQKWMNFTHSSGKTSATIMVVNSILPLFILSLNIL
uniref:NADH-ubiquinone oxidoreductase chain 2 n=1 Tax=Pseudophylus stundjuki TaxID=863833 RepID=A0A514LQT6_9HEMI|nr:NADH dehydrogenase subunit 2 [Pseudophylus stundjuki]